MRMKPLLWGALSLLILLGCSNSSQEVEIARFSPQNITTLTGEFFIAEKQVKLKANDLLKVWIDMDYQYEGEQELFFRFVILREEEYLREFYVNPKNMGNLEIAEISADDQGIKQAKYFGQAGDFSPSADGLYDFKVILMGSRNPSLKINKAELFLKMAKE